MQLTTTDVDAIRESAAEKPCILAVFLFGSRARGDAREDSDIDVAIRLDVSDAEPPLMGSCFGLYTAKGDEWQRDLAAHLGRHVSLEALHDGLVPDEDDWLGDAIVREGVQLWPL